MSQQVEESILNVRLSGDQAKAKIKELQDSIRGLSKEIKGLKNDPAQLAVKKDQVEEAQKKIDALRKSLKENLTVIINGEVAGKSLNDLKLAIALAKKQFGTMVDPAQAKQQAASINLIQKQIDHLEAPLKRTKNGFADIWNQLKTFAALTASAFGFDYIVSKVQDLITSNAKLSDSFADIRRVTGLSATEVTKLNKELQNIDTRTSMSGLRELVVVSGKLGVNGVKNLTDYTKALDMLVVSLGDELGNADEISTKLGKILNVFEGKITADGITHLGNAFVEMANNGVATGNFIAEFVQRVLNSAKAANFTLGSVVGLGAGFEELGLKVESSGTAFQTILEDIAIDLPKAAKIAGQSLAEFQKLFGESPEKALIAYSKGLVSNAAAFSEITQRFKDAGEEGQRVKSTLRTIGQNAEYLQAKIDLGNSSMQESSAIMDAFALKNESLGAQLEKTGKLVNKYFANPTLINFFKGLTGWTNTALQSAIEITNDMNSSNENALELSKKSILNNKEQIRSINDLTAEYQRLINKGLVPTTAEKGRIHAIANELNEITGKTIGILNKETGVYQVNVKEALKAANEKKQANLAEASSILEIIDHYKEQLAIFDDTIKKNKELQEALRAKNKEQAKDGILNSKGDASFIESKRLYDEIESAQRAHKTFQRELEKYNQILLDAGYTPESIRAALAVIRKTQEIIDKAKLGDGTPKAVEKADTSESDKEYREKSEKLSQYFRERITTITTYSIEERNLLRAEKIQLATDEQQAYGKELQEAVNAAKEKFDLAENGSKEELAARDEYRLALNKLDNYWDGLEVDNTRSKLKEVKNLQDKSRLQELTARVTEAQIALDLVNKNTLAELSAKKALIQAEFDLAWEGINKESSTYINAKRELNETLEQMDAQHTQYELNQLKTTLETVTQLYSEYNNFLTLRENNQTTHAKNEAAKRKKALDDELSHGRLSQEEYNKRIYAINQDADRKDRAAREKQFNRNKKLQQANIAINAASAIIAFYSEYNWYVATALGLLLTGLAATEINEVSKQEFPEYADGGYLTAGILNGPSHSDGGIDIRNKRTGRKFAEAEGGELMAPVDFVRENPVLSNAIADYRKNGNRLVFPLDTISSTSAPSVNTGFIKKTISRPVTSSYESSSTAVSASRQNSSGINPAVIDNSLIHEELKKQSKELSEMKELFKGVKDKKVFLVWRDVEKFLEQIKIVKDQSQL